MVTPISCCVLYHDPYLYDLVHFLLGLAYLEEYAVGTCIV